MSWQSNASRHGNTIWSDMLLSPLCKTEIPDMESGCSNAVDPPQHSNTSIRNSDFRRYRRGRCSGRTVYTREYHDGSDWSCEVCRVAFSNEREFRYHLTSKIHLSQLSSLVQQEKANRISLGDRVVAVKTGRQAVIQEKINNSPESIIGANNVTELLLCGSDPGAGSTADLATYACALCDVKCDCNLLLKHLSGYKHKLNTMRQTRPDLYAEVLRSCNDRLKQANMVEEFAHGVSLTDGPGFVTQKTETIIPSADILDSLPSDSSLVLNLPVTWPSDVKKTQDGCLTDVGNIEIVRVVLPPTAALKLERDAPVPLQDSPTSEQLRADLDAAMSSANVGSNEEESVQETDYIAQQIDPQRKFEKVIHRTIFTKEPFTSEETEVALELCNGITQALIKRRLKAVCSTVTDDDDDEDRAASVSDQQSTLVRSCPTTTAPQDPRRRNKPIDAARLACCETLLRNVTAANDAQTLVSALDELDRDEIRIIGELRVTADVGFGWVIKQETHEHT